LPFPAPPKACYGKEATPVDILVKKSVGNKGAVPPFADSNPPQTLHPLNASRG